MDPVETARGGEASSDVNLRAIVAFGAGLIVFVSIVLLLLGWLFTSFAARQAKLDAPPSPLAETQTRPLEPRLQVDPAQALREMRAAEDAILKSYGWVDHTAGIVRIPIDRAIEVLVERGLPVRATQPGSRKD